MRNQRQRKAFTIVEMSIVVAVIAILATIMIPTTAGIIKSSQVSSDQYFASTLTTQLALWEVEKNRTIDSEAALLEAIDHYYDDIEKVLTPGSGKYGYHFWYDVEDRCVILKKYDGDEGIVNIPSKKASAAIDPKLDVAEAEGSSVVAASKVIAVGTGVTPASNPITFSPSNPRSILNNKDRNYFLMDKAGSDLVTNLKALEAITDETDYGLKLNVLLATEGEASLANLIATRCSNIAIANAYGVFFSGNSTVNYVHIPHGTTHIGANQIASTVTTSVKEIVLPDTILQLGTNSLVGFTPATSANATIIYANVSADKLNEFVASYSFDGILVLPTGERYAFVSGKLTNLKTNSTVDTQYSVALQDFKVVDKNTADTTYDLHFMNDGNHILHITGDTTVIALKAEQFKDVNNNSTTRPVTWTKGEEAIGNDAEISLNAADLSNNDTITVTATDGISHTITVKKVGINTFDATIGQNKGEPTNTTNGVIYNATLYYYADGETWLITPNVQAFSEGCVQVSQAVDYDISGENKDKFEVVTISGKDYLKVNTTELVELEVVLTMTTEGKTIDGNNLTVTYNFEVKPASVFELTDNANTWGKYGLETFALGTVQAFTADTLFKLVDGKSANSNVTIELLASPDATPGSGTALATCTDGKWSTLSILPAATSNVTAYLSINDGGAPCTFAVKLYAGAYNVASNDDWIAAPNGNIAVLKGFTLADKTVTIGANPSNSEKSAGMDSITGNKHYSKNIGGNTIYGNYCTINIDGYKIIPYSYKGSWSWLTGPTYDFTNNYFLKITSGSLKNLIIDGPDYDKCAYSRTGTNGKNGYFVSGVETGSGTIENCYISGFRSPLYIQGNTTIKNSVIDGGAFANIYIHGTFKVTLTNVETYQYAQSGVSLGAGIFIDNNESSNTSVTLVADNLKQNNYYTSDQIKTIGNNIASGAGTLVLDNVGSLKKDDYYHAGIITWTETKNITTTVTKVNNYIVATCSQSSKNASIYGLGDNCPTRVEGYDITNNFLYSRYVQAYKDYLASLK